MVTICPSIASANPINLQSEIEKLGRYETKLHLDIEDGNYLTNISFGLKTVAAIARYTKAECDVHITATNPTRFVQPLAKLGIKAVCFHYELVKHPAEILNKIKRFGMKAGIALSFSTPPEALEMFIQDFDYVLFMTAEPDYAGEIFKPAILQRIKRARQMFPPQTSIWADGGIDEKTLPKVIESGADTIILGRAVWNAENVEAAMDCFYHIAENINK